MITPEANDVDISKLFNYKKAVEIGGLKVYLRLVGDAELNIARVKALRASAEMRKKLKDKNSDEYLAYIGDREFLNRDQLITMILVLKTKEFADDASKEVNVPFPSEPSEEATLEEQENYQQIVDSYVDRVRKEVSEYINNRIEKEKENLEKLSDDELFSIYESLQINQICENEMIRVFMEYCTYFGSYQDKKYTKRLFKSYDEFSNLPKEVKEKFLEEYNSLSIEPDELKK